VNVGVRWRDRAGEHDGDHDGERGPGHGRGSEEVVILDRHS
jgi:hypothetical protein